MNEPLCIYCTSEILPINSTPTCTCKTCNSYVDQIFWNYAFQDVFSPRRLKNPRPPLDNINNYYIVPIIRYKGVFYTDLIYKQVTDTYAFDCFNEVALKWDRLYCIPLHTPRRIDSKPFTLTHGFESKWLSNVLQKQKSTYEYVGGIFVL